ncbi:hypothetical protein K4F52_004974 [Lecanicillium sp. MT-2017a]|nr:hypothetical protein K4F52_004974 [Lecanicillium sp. MT-2017a]
MAASATANSAANRSSSSSTATMTNSAPPPSSNAKDSMKSTWRLADRSTWGPFHWIIEIINGYHWDLDKEIPVYAKTDKIPYIPQWSIQSWILLHSGIPLALHQLLVSVTGWNMPSYVAFGYYTAAFLVFIIREMEQIRWLGHRYGFLDGDVHERDGIPDVGVARVVMAGPKTLGGRMALATLLTYKVSEAPLDVMSSWTWWAWLPFQIGLYGVILDFWFYWYHRAMHDVGGLWKFHRTHHLTKHPNPLLGAYADDEQEFFDMIGVPFMTFLTFRVLGLPLGFYDWWICHQYIAFTELGGHSGLRLHIQAASPFGWLLAMLDCDIVTEDHDLHHRKGWRKSFNYGKQSRLWDRIFGTCGDRIESNVSNVDYSKPVLVPLP